MQEEETELDYFVINDVIYSVCGSCYWEFYDFFKLMLTTETQHQDSNNQHK